MLLENKNAVIHGGGGSIGGAVARTFAREGARVFLAGRTREPFDKVAEEIRSAGGVAETAQVDALDERAVYEHAREVAVVDALDERAVDENVQAVASQVGGVDVSFNLIWRRDAQGVPLASSP